MQALRPLRTGWPKSGQSFLFLLMLGPGSQRSRKQLWWDQFPLTASRRITDAFSW